MLPLLLLMPPTIWHSCFPVTTQRNSPRKKAPVQKPVLTLEQVRAALAEKSHDGKTEAVRELLQKYGAPKLSAVDPKHYPALLKDAEVL